MTLSAAPARPRDGAAGACSCCAAATPPPARRGARRRCAADAAREREQVFWGWGEPGAGPSLPEHAGAFLREELGLDGGVVRRRSRWRTCACARRRCARGPRARSRRRSAPSTCATTARRACCAAAASPTSTCWPSGPATARRRPDAVVAPGRRTTQVAGGAARVRGGGRRGRAVRRRDQRRRRPRGRARAASRRSSRSTSGGMDRVMAVDERSLTAVLEPGLRLPEAERALRAHGLRARARAAELRVGDGRRLRRDPLGRPGLDRARAHRRARRRAALRDAGRASWRRSDAPGERRRAGAARARARLGGGARRDHARRAARAARWRRRSATRAGSSRSFVDGGEALRRLEQDGLAPDIARLSDETRRA